MVDTIDSTNSELLRLPREQALPGTALLALTQSGGKGRFDRVFESPRGGMYLSAVLEPQELHALCLLGAKALLRLLDHFGLQGELRWPNDVLLRGRKIGGVLPVARFYGNLLERAVLGVGLNVAASPDCFPQELRPELTSLSQALPKAEKWDVVAVARDYLEALELESAFLESGGMAQFCRSCEPYLLGLGDGLVPVLVEPGSPPRTLAAIRGLDSDGSLLLEDGERLSALGREQRLRLQ